MTTTEPKTRQPLTPGEVDLINHTLGAVFKGNMVSDAPAKWKFDHGFFGDFQAVSLTGPDSYINDQQGVYAFWQPEVGVMLQCDHLNMPRLTISDARALVENLTVVLKALDAQGVTGRESTVAK